MKFFDRMSLRNRFLVVPLLAGDAGRSDGGVLPAGAPAKWVLLKVATENLGVFNVYTTLFSELARAHSALYELLISGWDGVR